MFYFWRIFKKKSLYWWLFGLALIGALLYWLVLRHSGYILLWDFSGAFDSRAPFDQYWFLYSPYDGLNVGVKNRLPIAAVIQLLYTILRPIWGLHPADVAKIALVLLFGGTYTSFFWLLPRWIKLFLPKRHSILLAHRGWNAFRVLTSLLYLFIPAFTYRLPHWHLFFLSIFYPLQVYFFIRLVEEKKFRWHLVSAFILTLFWGLTSPHAIAFTGLTVVCVYAFFIGANLFKKPRRVGQSLIRIAVAGVGTLVTQLYWIIPYLMVSSPAPGYVINQQMVDLLSKFSTLPHFILGDAEWYIDQAQLGVISADSGLAVVQVLGLIVFLGGALILIIKTIRHKYTLAILLLLVVVGLLAIKGNPVHNWFYDSAVYSSYGWILRDSNRIAFIWNYWLYLMFSLGLVWLAGQLLTHGKSLNTWVNGLLMTSFIIFYCAYTLPTAFQFLSYTQPEALPNEAQEVFNVLDRDPDNFYVQWYPSNQPYRLPWRPERFLLSDSIEYNFFPYLAPRPPAGYSGSVPNGKSIPDLVAQFAVANNQLPSSFGEMSTTVGVKYWVIYKAPAAYWQSATEVETYTIKPLVDYLNDTNTFSKVVDNEYFLVYKNNQFVNHSVLAANQEILVVDDLKLTRKLDSRSLLSNSWTYALHPEAWATLKTPIKNQHLAIFADNANYFLDLISNSDRNRYTIYPYDFVHDYGLGVAWGRASLIDRINGEMRTIFDRYGINSWSFDQNDKFVYSDQTIEHPEEKAQTTFNSKVSCVNGCSVYVKLLQNHLAGDVTIIINNQSFNLKPKDDFEVYRWVKLTDGMSFPMHQANISLISSNGFTSLGGILVMPQTTVSQYKEQIEHDNTIYQIPTTTNDGSFPIPNSGLACDWQAPETITGVWPSLNISGQCATASRGHLAAFNGYVIAQNNKDNSFEYSRNFAIPKGAVNLTIYLFSHYDLIMWGLFIIDGFYILLLAIVAMRSREKAHVRKHRRGPHVKPIRRLKAAS